jgi:signal transduction histidine kinase
VEELLVSFMVGSTPDAGRFRHSLEGVLGSHTRFGDGARERRPVLAFSELVDVLCRQGNIDAAIRVEELWNELAESYTFSMLCAYSLSTFSEDTHDAALRAVCNQHAHVLPTERYMRADDGARMREIALLQQRACALETELERRRVLEAELRDALRVAQAASRAKSDFLTVMSHELRTPLNAIGGHTQILEMGLHGPINEAQREALGRVQKSQRHLLGMINDLLNLSEVDAGRVRYEIEHVPIGPALHSVAKLLTPHARASGLAITVAPLVDGEARADPREPHRQRGQILDAGRSHRDRREPVRDGRITGRDPRARHRGRHLGDAAGVDLRAVRPAWRAGARSARRDRTGAVDQPDAGARDGRRPDRGQ